MLMLITALLVATACAVALFRFASHDCHGLHFFAGVIGVCISAASAGTAITLVWSGWNWFAAEHQARVINREYGTNYTQEEIYWAKDVIDTIRELDRKRIEINGDLMRDEPDKGH